MSSEHESPHDFTLEEQQLHAAPHRFIVEDLNSNEELPFYKKTIKQVPKPLEISLGIVCLVGPCVFGYLVWNDVALNDWCLHHLWLWFFTMVGSSVLSWVLLLRQDRTNVVVVIIFLVLETYSMGIWPSLIRKSK